LEFLAFVYGRIKADVMLEIIKKVFGFYTKTYLVLVFLTVPYAALGIACTFLGYLSETQARDNLISGISILLSAVTFWIWYLLIKLILEALNEPDKSKNLRFNLLNASRLLFISFGVDLVQRAFSVAWGSNARVNWENVTFPDFASTGNIEYVFRSFLMFFKLSAYWSDFISIKIDGTPALILGIACLAYAQILSKRTSL
jgi:hypothetical protein